MCPDEEASEVLTKSKKASNISRILQAVV